MVMKIAVVDDEAHFQQEIYHMLENHYQSLDVVIDCFSEGKTLLERMEKSNITYDIAILDIEMPAMNGMELAQKIQGQQVHTEIIFLTSYMEYALQGYEVQALRYLLKPVQEEKLIEALECVEKRRQKEQYLFLKDGRGEERVPLREILYMEAINQDIMIYMKHQVKKVRYNLKEYEKELEKFGFVRIHRSYLANLLHTKRLEKAELVMDNDSVLPVSRTRYQFVRKRLWEYVKNEAV